MNYYRAQTERLIELLKTEDEKNAMLDFFTQLSRIRSINSIPIVNALNFQLVDSSTMISECTTERPWMKRISLEDLRNHVVFVMWKEFHTVVNSEDYVDKTITDERYVTVAQRHGLLTEDLYTFLETSFYISQICILRELIEDNFDDMSIIQEPEWLMYHDWIAYHIHTHGLSKTIYENFKLIDKLIV